LIDVAKHLWRDGMSHRDAVSHAYQIIREAHLLSGNLRHLNQRSHPTTESIFDLVWSSERNDHDQPLRAPLLVALMKSMGRGPDPSNVSKKFNDWFRESLRKESFLAVMPHDATAPGFDPKLHQQLRENGWLRYYEDDRGGQHLIIPSGTQPMKPLKHKPSTGKHITQAYWNTTDAWWPEADPKDLDKRKAEYLNPAGEAFLNAILAERALERFKAWLELERQMKKSPARKKQPKNESGEFVSPKDKGAGRTKNGQFGGTRKKSGNS
jgi:hypothetical protein